LYDLETDISEKNNALKSHPEVAKRLRSYAEAFEKELAQKGRPAAFVDDPKPLAITK